jgi:hypothetical protein
MTDAYWDAVTWFLDRKSVQAFFKAASRVMVAITKERKS